MALRTLRLRIKDGEELSSLAEHPAVRTLMAGKSRILDRSETYFDTPNLKLYQRGFLLKARRLGGKWVGLLTWLREGDEVSKEWECGVSDAPPDWLTLKKQFPSGKLDGIKLKSLEVLFEVERLEERWQLLFPDGGRMTIRELHGAVRSGSVRRPFHEVVLESQAGTLDRFFQISLALARHFSAFVEPLSPVMRGFVRREPALLPMNSWSEKKVGHGGRAVDLFATVGGLLLQWMLDHLASLEYGTEARQQEAVQALVQDVKWLRTLVRLFDFLLPEKLLKDMETELEWLAGELEPLRAWGEMLTDTLIPLQDRFAEYPILAQAVTKGGKRQKEGLKQALQAVESLRFTQWLLGFAGALIGKEGVVTSLAQSDLVLLERMASGVDGVIFKALRRSHQLLCDQGGHYWRTTTGADSPWESLSGVDDLLYTARLFPEFFADKKMGRYLNAVIAVHHSLQQMALVANESRLWSRLALGKEDQVHHLFKGWQGARMAQGMDQFKQAWELFMATSVPFA